MIQSFFATYSGTPPYDHLVCKTTSLLRPGFYGPTVVVLTGFHCSCSKIPVLNLLRAACHTRVYLSLRNSLRASSPIWASEASREGPAKGELATIPYKFSFVLRPDEGKWKIMFFSFDYATMELWMHARGC